jgi:hypothetical protein
VNALFVGRAQERTGLGRTRLGHTREGPMLSMHPNFQGAVLMTAFVCLALTLWLALAWWGSR